MKIIFADFNNIDRDGFLRLNCSGTVADLTEGGLALEEGLLLTLSDGDLVAPAVVRSPSDEGVWRAQIIGAIEECGST